MNSRHTSIPSSSSSAIGSSPLTSLLSSPSLVAVSSSAMTSTSLGTPNLSNQYGSIRAGITHTPLVMGTPMTPQQYSSSSSASAGASTHTPITHRNTALSVSSIARGDIGRGLGRAIFIPQSPQTNASNDSFQQSAGKMHGNAQGQAPPTPG